MYCVLRTSHCTVLYYKYNYKHNNNNNNYYYDSTLLCSTPLHSFLLYSTLLCTTLLYSTPLHSTPLYSTFYTILCCRNPQEQTHARSRQSRRAPIS